MHVAMVIDEERLTHEHAMLRRLCIGLIDHGVRLTRMVPPPETISSEAARASEEKIALAPRILVPGSVLPWWRGTRKERIIESLHTGGGKGGDQALPDVIYAIGRDTWQIALDLADAIDRPVVINVWSAALIGAVPQPRAASGTRWGMVERLAPNRLRGAQQIAAYVAASAPIAEALGERVDPAMIALVPMGASIPREPHAIFAHHPQSLGAAVIGRCADLRAYAAMLGGLSHVVRDHPNLHVALELRGRRCHDVWRLAKRSDLLRYISPIDDAAQHRELLTRCDILIVPERTGETSSLLLEAMGAGMPVIARNDPFLDVARDEETALLVKSDEPEEWASQLSRVLEDPDLARRVGEQGRRRIQQTHSSSEQVRRLAETLEWIARGGAYSFSAGH